MAAPKSTFTLTAPTQKFDDFASLEPHISTLLAPTAASKITHISFSGNTLGVSAAEGLAPHLSALAALESANLADLFTGRLLHEIPPALDALLGALLKCRKLVTVDLSDNAFGRNTAEPLVRFLQRHTPLRHLILNNNGIGPEAGTLVATALVQLAEEKRKEGQPLLETVVCGRNRLENGSMPAWAKAYVAHSASISEVKMVQNGIRPEGLQTLLTGGLGTCTKLRRLDLQDNTFTKLGAVALSSVLGNWNDIEDLGFSDCLIGNRRFELIVQALGKGKNEKLEVLRCTYGEIEARGVRRLVEVVKAGALKKLKNVELNGNKFSEDDPAIEDLRTLLEDREGGLDDLSDLEEESDDEDGGEESEEEDEQRGDEARGLAEADQEENENVAQEKDKDVDDLAEKLGTSGI